MAATRILRHVLGWTLLAGGVAGILLPVIPGIPLLIAAAAVLGSDHFLIRPWKKHFDRWRAERKKTGGPE